MRMAAIAKMLFISFLFLSSVFLARSGEVDDEREFSYDEKRENGPANWSNIRPDWKDCSGKLQSPIDLLDLRAEVVSNLGILQKDYKPSNATLLNRGHDIMLRLADGGYLKINETQYQLKQLHWHTPSEHTVNGERFNLEAHLVHESNNGQFAVIGILYEIGLLPDPFLSMIENELKVPADKNGKERAIGTIDPNQIKLDGKNYFRYIGSLTTPPCTEGVVWTIDRKVKTVTRRQINLLHEAVQDGFETNARPTQPENKRSINSTYHSFGIEKQQ
ncbi:PREDICTED: bifunctional monodehydroascorbate reductase and carbonic anhydrase nectarin-3 [Nicotiana attenuata]|uniref:Carbonic anhydrase n=1 Tax=Nicotiana attenuata TaxID=49451 RepID=A0A314KWY1_NICAT|nr:PREDICTED: bifunctional monodehydroascorbate reductase and carbonic anhydrase nectarin-3 [Nicotiana attenuata]OIT33507.1 bifunctional monodehydroascorbate reductase and carbonic anhydrase nectarin-3 [Nicotiana attenuata]